MAREEAVCSPGPSPRRQVDFHTQRQNEQAAAQTAYEFFPDSMESAFPDSMESASVGNHLPGSSARDWWRAGGRAKLLQVIK